MANEVKMSLTLEGKQALDLLNKMKIQLKDTGDVGEKSTSKLNNGFSTMVGNLGAIASVKAFQFLKAQLAESFDSFVTFEAGLIAVAKTANLSASEVEELSRNILQLSKELPVGTEELLAIATAAGQLGVKGTKDITLFTSTVAKLGKVSNLSGDQAATTLARILNITGQSIGTVDNFASIIVSLGNNFAASESDIASMTSEVARATTNFGVSAGEAAALSAVLTSMGVRAEEAGGVMTKAFVAIQDAINAGGAKMESLQKITGKTGDQIKKQFGENATGFFRDFVASLNTAEGGLKNASRNLATLGIEGIRVQKVIPVLAKNVGELDRALALYNAEAGGTASLTEEYGKSLESTQSQTQLLSNSLERLRIRIGEGLAKALGKVNPLLIGFIDKVGKSKVELFAEGTEDLKVLNKELEIYKKKLASVKAGEGFSIFAADPKELAGDIKTISDRIIELGDNKTANTLSNLRTELKSLQEQAKNQDPVLAAISGDAGELDRRTEEVKAQIANIEQAQILSGQRIVEANKANADADKETAQKKLTFMQELAAARTAAAGEEEALATEAKKLASDTDLQFLEENLGALEAKRELHRINQIENDKKRNEELKKLQLKALQNEKDGHLFALDFSKKTGKAKVAAQKQVLSDISGLQASSNSTAFAIGKAASLALAYINTSQAVTNALANVPYPFAIPAAIAVGASGAIQIAKIASASPPKAQSFADGGIVGGNSFSGDNLQANVNSGEMILNQRQQKNLFNGVDSGNLGGGGGTNITINNPMVLSEDGVSNLIDEINDAIEFKNKELKVG